MGSSPSLRPPRGELEGVGRTRRGSAGARSAWAGPPTCAGRARRRGCAWRGASTAFGRASWISSSLMAELRAVLGRELDVDRLVVAVQEHAPPVGVPLDPLVMGDVQVHVRNATADRAAVTLARCSATSPTRPPPAASTAASCPTPSPARTTRSWPSARTRSTAASCRCSSSAPTAGCPARTWPARSSRRPPTAAARRPGRAWSARPTAAAGRSASPIPSHRLAELPGAVSFEDAAALPVAGLTAYRALQTGGPAARPPRARHRRDRRRRLVRRAARRGGRRARHRAGQLRPARGRRPRARRARGRHARWTAPGRSTWCSTASAAPCWPTRSTRSRRRGTVTAYGVAGGRPQTPLAFFDFAQRRGAARAS